MRCLSWRRPACGLLAALALTAFPQVGWPAEPERVKFPTFDAVEICGNYYASSKGKKAPCAMLLHPIGSSSQQEGWDKLAQDLNAKGFAVLTFDFRGHGDSTTVRPEFWNVGTNQSLKSYHPGKLRDTISYKDFTNQAHFLTLVNDIAAAKRFFDERNDGSECNSSNLVVVGADSGATLGALWIRSEWQRRHIYPFGVPVPPRPRLEGEDIRCAVWLSISPDIGLKTKWKMPVDGWLRDVAKQEVQMAFIYGEQDTQAAKFSKHLCDQVLRAEKDPKLKWTGRIPIKDTKLSGVELVKPSLETSSQVVKYADKVLGELRPYGWADRDVKRSTLYRVPFESFLR